MSSYSVVFQNKDSAARDNIFKASNFGALSDLEFTKDGKVKAFVYDSVNYYSVYDVSTLLFIDYVDKERFNRLINYTKKKDGPKYSGVSTKLWKTGVKATDLTFNRYSELTKGVPGDLIYGKLKDETGLCYNYYVWPLVEPYIGPPDNPAKFTPGSASIDCDVFENGSIAQSFFNHYKNIEFGDPPQPDNRLVGEIASLMDSVNKKLITAFNGFVVHGINTGDFTFIPADPNGYSKQNFIDYRNALRKWLEIYQQNVEQLKGLSDPEKVYIICEVIGNYNMLSTLSVDLKIELLKVLASGVLTNWTIFSFKNYAFQHREALAVKIVESVTNDQAQQFLGKLISTFITETRTVNSTGVMGTSETISYDLTSSLYKILFYKIDDYGGKDNFTAFIKKINSLVLFINEVTNDDASNLSTSELQAITPYNFIWGTDSKKIKRNYTVSKRNDSTIEFDEKIPIETTISDGLLNLYLSTMYTGGVSQLFLDTLFPEKVKKYVNNKIILPHFELVSIHFYENPTFIDTTDKTGPIYKGRHFLTFAGFVDYIIEKEDTQLIDDIIQGTLFAISLAFGFGEFVTAVRTASIARALAGAIIVSGDTSVYLASNSQFRSYIMAKYPHDYQKILVTMQLVGAVASLGGMDYAGKIFNAYSIEQGADFISTARYVLADAKMRELLTQNDIAILKEGIVRFSKNIEYYKDTSLVKSALRRAKAAMMFYDSNELKTAIFSIPEVNSLRFLDEYSDISPYFLKKLKENNEDFIAYWNGLSEERKQAFLVDKEAYFVSWYNSKVSDIVQRMRLWWNPDTDEAFNLHELFTLAEIDIKYKLNLRPVEAGEAGDAIATTGIFAGQSYDAFGTPAIAFTKPTWQHKYNRELRKMLESIDAHFLKIAAPKAGRPPLNKFILDMKNYDEFKPSLRTTIMQHISAPNYPFKSYVNIDYFEIIN